MSLSMKREAARLRALAEHHEGKRGLFEQRSLQCALKANTSDLQRALMISYRDKADHHKEAASQYRRLAEAAERIGETS
jgi:hypothetical protein